MAASSLSTYNSSVATDPLRGFRFTASFTPVASAGTVFSPKIGDATSGSTLSTGASSGWVGGFTGITGLSITTQSIAYREGGYNTTVHQIPGMTTFLPVVFTRGVLYGADQAITWMRGLFAASAGAGLNPGTNGGSNFRVDVVINVLQHPNTNADSDTPQIAFKIHNAWITGLSYSDLDATNGAILFESMSLIHEGLSVYYTNSDGTPVSGSSDSPSAGGGSGPSFS